MKRIKKAFTAIALTALLFSASPVITYAQDAGTSTTTATTDDNDDGDNDYGWIGLAGLLGLLGLIRKDNDRRTTTTVRNDR
jgi:hypothetical protein